MCNACGIYYKNHGYHRPLQLIDAAVLVRVSPGAGSASGDDGDATDVELSHRELAPRVSPGVYWVPGSCIPTWYCKRFEGSCHVLITLLICVLECDREEQQWVATAAAVDEGWL